MSERDKIATIEFIKCRDDIELDYTRIYVSDINTITINFEHVYYSISTMLDITSNMLDVCLYDVDTLETVVKFHIDESGIEKSIPDRELFEFLDMNEYALLKISIWNIITLIERCNSMLNKRNAIGDLIREYGELPIHKIC